MKITIQTIYTKSWQDVAGVVLQNTIDYCRKHGYSWNIQMFPEPYNAFDKIQQIIGLFEFDAADVVVSLDCDALITNHRIKIEDIVDNEYSFWITKDVNGLNGGVFIAKNTKWCADFLEFVMEYEKIANCEQDAIALYMDDNPGDKNISILPQKTMNSYMYELYPEFGRQTEENGEWIEGKSFILHLPGIGMEKRKEILSHTPIIL